MNFVAMLARVVLLAGGTGQSSETILASVDYSLDTAHVRRYELEAIDGSAESATKLMNYFRFAKHEARLSEYWARIGAENGSAEAEFRVYQLMGTSRDPLKQGRALYWLKQSAAQGYPSAQTVFETCNSLTATYSDRERSPCFGPGSQD